MCGITGIVHLTDSCEINRNLMQAMNDSQTHRGPDGSGYHFEPGVGFGHRRLSIIDIDGGKQPMFNEDRSVVITYNGEIYDFSELMTELKAAGHTFETRCDTEVIIHAWEQWGENCLERLHGMFAFAIWDRNRETLFIARDRFGKKPLFYSRLRNNSIVFSSELKALLVHPEVSRELDPTAVEDYMTFGYVPDPKTIFRSIYKLPPGYFIKAKRGDREVVPHRYWDIKFDSRAEYENEQAVSDDLNRMLASATKRRLISDVPLGAFLSGGVDSSAIVASMAGLTDGPVNTCSISFGDPAFNEAKYAQKVANLFKTNHRVGEVDANDFDLIDRIPGIYDEPFADSSAIPTYRVCELARKHVTVALSGDGGDEIFAGYRRYRWHMHEHRIRKSIPRILRKSIFGTAGKIYPKLDWAPRIFRAKSTLQAIARDSLDAYLHSVSILPNDLHGRLFTRKFSRDLQGYTAREVFREHADNCDTDDELSLIQYLDIKTYLPGDILTKVDRASMANSLEVRVPLLDSEFTEWACSLPSSLKLRGREGKYIFKKALEGSVPNDILYREKMGFAVPLAAWFRGPLRETVHERLLGDSMRECGIFDIDFIERILQQHTAGVRDFSPPIWALLVFAGFYRSIST